MPARQEGKKSPAGAKVQPESLIFMPNRAFSAPFALKAAQANLSQGLQQSAQTIDHCGCLYETYMMPGEKFGDFRRPHHVYSIPNP